MPRQEFITRPEAKSDIYALMLVLAAVFVLAAVVLTYAELAKDYDLGVEGAKQLDGSGSIDADLDDEYLDDDDLDIDDEELDEEEDDAEADE